MTATRRSAIVIAIIAAAAGAVLTAALDRTVLAQQEPMNRTILKRVPDPGNPKYDIVLGISEMAPGASSGKHRHPGVEVGYVLEGAMTVDYDGGKSASFKAGDAMSNENHAVHNAHNTGTTPVRPLAVWVAEKDKPLAESVK